MKVNIVIILACMSFASGVMAIDGVMLLDVVLPDDMIFLDVALPSDPIFLDTV